MPDHDELAPAMTVGSLATAVRMADAAYQLVLAENKRLWGLLQRVHDDLLAEFGREDLSKGKYEHPDRIDLLFQAIEAELTGRSESD